MARNDTSGRHRADARDAGVLAERNVGLQRQLDRMAEAFAAYRREVADHQRESEARVTALTDAKFVTYRTLIDSQAEKVALALSATQSAINKAEIATSKALDKEAEANADRFAKVNEFRAQQSELITRFATLERVDLLYNQTRQRVEEINSNMLARLGELIEWRNRTEGHTGGVKDNRTGIYAAIAAAVGVIAIIVFISNYLTSHA